MSYGVWMPESPEFQLSNSQAVIRPSRVDAGLDVDDARRAGSSPT